MSEARDPEGEPQGPRLPGIAYPLLALVFGGILVWSFSRVLLAVSKDMAVVIAILMAANILVGAALVAYGRRVRGRPVAFPFLMAAGAIVVAGGLVSAVAFGDRAPGERAEGGGGETVSLAAQNIAFDTTSLTLTAGANVTMIFDNRDAGTPHNVVITRDEAGTDFIFQGAEVDGPAKATYTFTAPPPGSYFFHCMFHPTQMKGTVTATAGPPPSGSPPPGGGPPPGAIPLEAKNIAFDKTELTAPSGGQVTIHFSNQDPQTPHNFSIYTDESATTPIFQGPNVTGPGSTDYTFAAPEPGEYFFRCDIHPTIMTGTITFTG